MLTGIHDTPNFSGVNFWIRGCRMDPDNMSITISAGAEELAEYVRMPACLDECPAVLLSIPYRLTYILVWVVGHARLLQELLYRQSLARFFHAGLAWVQEGTLNAEKAREASEKGRNQRCNPT